MHSETGLAEHRRSWSSLRSRLRGRQSFDSCVSGEPVGLGAHDEEFPLDGTEIFDELLVAGLRRDVGVDEADAEGEGFAFVEVGLDEVGPFGGDGLRDFGVAVAGQVGEDERGAEVCLARRASWRAKKLMARVRPGVEETLASLEPRSLLMSDDLPTLERPRKAISGTDGTGNCSGAKAEIRNFG